MCLYWRRLHTCHHVSDRPCIEMCRPGFLSNTVCPDIREDESPRASHFPCYNCIKAEARAEHEEKARHEREELAKAIEEKLKANKEKQTAELKAKEEKIRQEAREKAIREREEELSIKRAKEEEDRQAKKEGGLWIETGHGKKGKNRKNGGNSGLTPPLSAPAVMKTVPGFKDRKENSPKKERSMDTGGRVGHWGPKKILSRKENVSANTTGGATNNNANDELNK